MQHKEIQRKKFSELTLSFSIFAQVNITNPAR